MFPSISSILYFLGHPWEFSTPLTALVDDDKQLDDEHKDTSQELLGNALDTTFILSTLIFLLKSYIISLLCRDIGAIYLILLSRLRC